MASDRSRISSRKARQLPGTTWAGAAVGDELVHVRVDMNGDGARAQPLAQRPVHGVALVHTRPEHDQHIGNMLEQGRRGVARAA